MNYELTKLRFEELSTRELYEILRCRAEIFVVEQNCVYQDIDEADLHSYHLFIEENGKIKSYLRVIDPGVKFACASIGRVLTMPEYRGKGLARMLMLQAIKLAKSLSPTIEIEAQSYLLDFYKSLGFTVSSDVFLLDGIPHISLIHNS